MTDTMLDEVTAKAIVAEVSANGERVYYRSGHSSYGEYSNTAWVGTYGPEGGDVESYTYEVQSYVCEAYSETALHVWAEDENHEDGGSWEVLWIECDQH